LDIKKQNLKQRSTHSPSTHSPIKRNVLHTTQQY